MTRPHWRPCHDCPTLIKGNAKRCPPCSSAHTEAYKKRRAEAMRSPVKHLQLRRGRSVLPPVLERREVRYMVRADFVSHFQEMRAELERQTIGLRRTWIEPADPLALPVLGTQRGTGRQG